MPSTRVAYRDRGYRLHIAADRLEEFRLAYAALQARPTYSTAAFAHGQFAEIVSAMECTFAASSSEADSTTCVRVRRSYRGAQIGFSLPVAAFFYCTVVIEELFVDDDVRHQHLSLEDFRARCRAIFVPCSAYTPGIFVWDKLWLLPPAVPRPFAGWDAMVASLSTAPSVISPTASRASFSRIWTTCVETATSQQPSLYVACHAHGRRWSITVPTPTALAVRLLVEDLLQDLPPDSSAMQAAWATLSQQHAVATHITIPDTLAFQRQDWSYSLAPGAWEPRAYASDVVTQRLPCGPPEATLSFWCRLCGWTGADRDSWNTHLDYHGGFQAYRQQLLAQHACDWPQPLDPKELRTCMASYSDRFHAAIALPTQPCACCACNHVTDDRSVVWDLRAPPFDLLQLHPLFSARSYLERLQCLYVDAPAEFLGLALHTFSARGVPVPAFGGAGLRDDSDSWLLYIPSDSRELWDASVAEPDRPLEVFLCATCFSALSRQPPRLPALALANGNFCCPLPTSLQTLTFAETLFVSRGYTLHRLHTLPGRAAPADRQQALRGNVISFPQNAAQIFNMLPRPVSSAAEMLTVLFPRDDLQDLTSCPEYHVRRQRVLEALRWLTLHNPYYTDVTIDYDALETLPLDGPLVNVGCSAPAADLTPEPGPADAQPGPATVAHMPVAAAVLDTEGAGLLPTELWRQALSTENAPDDDLVAAVPHGSTPLSSFHPAYWTWCFPTLFPYGDGLPSTPRLTRLTLRDWGRHLLLRRDRCLSDQPWALDLHFLATLFGVLHRKDLLQAVRAKFSTPGFLQQVQDLPSLRTEDFDILVNVLHDSGSVRQALRAFFLHGSKRCFLRIHVLVSFPLLFRLALPLLASEVIRPYHSHCAQFCGACSWWHEVFRAPTPTVKICGMSFAPCSFGTAYPAFSSL